MYGLGDEAPAQDTVALMEDILIEFLQETVCIRLFIMIMS